MESIGTIVIVGLGTLGSRVVRKLPVRAKILLIDYDVVEPRNVGTQYPAIGLGKYKVDVARELYRPDADVIAKHIDWSTVDLLHDAGLVIDCTDNMLARHVINDYCAKHGIPWIHSGLSDTAGTVATFLPDGPCFSCVYREDTSAEDCTPHLSIPIAEETARVVAQELERFHKMEAPRFIRITAHGKQVLEMQRRAGCATCAGTYKYLEPRDFYLTYCVNAGCLAAKPLRHTHDHGHSETRTMHGVHVTIYENGEIHFHGHAEDDLFFKVAREIYTERATKHASEHAHSSHQDFTTYQADKHTHHTVYHSHHNEHETKK